MQRTTGGKQQEMNFDSSLEGRGGEGTGREGEGAWRILPMTGTYEWEEEGERATPKSDPKGDRGLLSRRRGGEAKGSPIGKRREEEEAVETNYEPQYYKRT